MIVLNHSYSLLFISGHVDYNLPVSVSISNLHLRFIPELNFAEKIRNLEKTLNSWKRRNLTLYGKINIVKTFGLSKLIYNTSVLVIPENFVKEIDKLIFNFIWDGKPAKIKKINYHW